MRTASIAFWPATTPFPRAVTPLQTLVSAWLMPSAEGLLVMDSSRNGIYTLQGPKLLPLYTLTEDEPQELWFADSPVFAQGQVFFLYGSSAQGSMLYAFDPETETLGRHRAERSEQPDPGARRLLYAFQSQHIVSLSPAQPTAAQEVAEVSMFADGWPMTPPATHSTGWTKACSMPCGAGRYPRCER